VPLKLIHVNRCPVVAPLKVLRGEDQKRLQLDMALYEARRQQLSEAQEVWRDKVQALYAGEDFAPSEDPEQQLYDGFIGDRDRRLCEQVRSAEPEQLARGQWPFDDERLPELLFRYRARNFPTSLSEEEQQRWRTFCRQRLTEAAWGAPNTLADFTEHLMKCLLNATPAQRQVLEQWQDYALSLCERFNLTVG